MTAAGDPAAGRPAGGDPHHGDGRDDDALADLTANAPPPLHDLGDDAAADGWGPADALPDLAADPSPDAAAVPAGDDWAPAPPVAGAGATAAADGAPPVDDPSAEWASLGDLAARAAATRSGRGRRRVRRGAATTDGHGAAGQSADPAAPTDSADRADRAAPADAGVAPGAPGRPTDPPGAAGRSASRPGSPAGTPAPGALPGDDGGAPDALRPGDDGLPPGALGAGASAVVPGRPKEDPAEAGKARASRRGRARRRRGRGADGTTDGSDGDGTAASREPERPLTAEERLQHALTLAYRHLSKRDRTVSEVRAHLEKREVDEASIVGALAELVDFGYLDDERYAARFVEDKRRLEGWGHLRIEQGLRRTGIPREVADRALEDDPLRADEDDLAVEALERRLNGRALEDDRARQKALRLLATKGYTLETAYAAVRTYERRCAERDG